MRCMPQEQLYTVFFFFILISSFPLAEMLADRPSENSTRLARKDSVLTSSSGAGTELERARSTLTSSSGALLFPVRVSFTIIKN